MYLDEAEAKAYDIGLKPWEFQRMTPAELRGMVDGYERRQESLRELAAFVVMHMYAPHMRKGKKPPSIDALLGRKPRKP